MVAGTGLVRIKKFIPYFISEIKDLVLSTIPTVVFLPLTIITFRMIVGDYSTIQDRSMILDSILYNVLLVSIFLPSAYLLFRSSQFHPKKFPTGDRSFIRSFSAICFISSSILLFFELPQLINYIFPS